MWCFIHDEHITQYGVHVYMYGSKQIFVDKDVENGRTGACDFLLHVCVCLFMFWVVVRLHILIIGDELKDSKKA